MSIIFQTVVNTGKLYPFRKSLNTKLSACKCWTTRKFSDAPKKFVSFEEVIAQRRDEARRSIVVQVNSDASFNELHSYCSKYASVNGIHHYKNSVDEHFMLVEFSTEDNMKNVIQSCSTHQKDLEVMGIQSPFLWFRAASGKNKKLISDSRLVTINGTMQINEDELFDQLLKCNTMSDQIQLLYDQTALNDLGVRLRYMVARQLECILQSLYANIVVKPFGSSINGFGKMGCDLDLVLTNMLTNNMTDPTKRLVYQDKKSDSGRGWQRHVELLGELLELRAPGVTRVQRIPYARVPIVKYAHQFTDLDVDLCYNNMSGVHMSELLCALGALDGRVRALAGAVRRWARAHALTHAHPGRWITNFPLTLMVIFFLQQKGKDGCVLPSVRTLIRRAEKEDIRVAEENMNCTFLRDLNKLPPNSYGQNPADLQSLLLQFFEFYAQFDFNEKAISIIDGTSVRKPNSLPLYIVNPLEPSLNVSRNVSYEECERFKLEVKNAAWHLEGNDGTKTDEWGILAIIEKKSTRGLKRLLRAGNSHRLISVKDLFNEEETKSDTRLKSDKEIEASVKEMKNSMETNKDLKNVEPRMKFKNSQVASEVYRIRRDKMV